MSDFGKEVREAWKQAEEADKDNREEALNDLKFAAGEHWDSQVREYRERIGIERYGFPLPCLTINTLPQFVGQVIGDRRANATAIKVLPREDGDVKVAEIRSELIRSIELQSKADRVYNQAFEQAVTCGVGNFRIDLDYAYEDAFERDLFIRSIANPLAVLWDPLAADPTGRDAGYCFVSDRISRDEFKRKYPKATSGEQLDAIGVHDDWVDQDTARVAEYHKIEERTRQIALMMDGSVEDVTDTPEKDWQPRLWKGADGTEEPRVRKAQCKYATMVMTNGREELSDPFELKLPRLPIIRVTGREVWVGDKRKRFGLVRFARDPARLKDYNRSVRAELLMLMPRANFIAEERAIEGRVGDWPNTLVHNDGSAPPVPIAAQLAAALLEEAEMFSQDMKDTTGIHEASLGMNGNETSGVAIQRRQNEGDIAAIVYHDNMNGSMQEGGEVLNALIPTVYDTARTIRTVGADDGVKLIRVNDPGAKDGHVDLAVGRYDVTVSTGPAYATRRQEAAAQLMELSSRAPQLLEAAGDLIIGELDIPGGAKIQERVKRMIPPQILGDDADDGMSDEEKAQKAQQAQQAQQKQQAMEQLQFEGAQAEVELKKAQAAKAQAEAMKAEAEAHAAMNGGEEVPDPIAQDKNRIAAFDAQTRRLSALGKSDFVLPPEAAAMIAPAVTQAVMHALGLDAVTPDTAVEIAHASLREMAEKKDAEDRAEQRDTEQMQAKQPPQKGAQQ